MARRIAIAGALGAGTVGASVKAYREQKQKKKYPWTYALRRMDKKKLLPLHKRKAILAGGQKRRRRVSGQKQEISSAPSAAEPNTEVEQEANRYLALTMHTNTQILEARMLIRTRSSFDILQQYKNCGQLIIYYIDAPPRTAGSALHRAIAQATDAHAYEPFHIPPDGFTKGLGDILAQVESASERPVRVVVKEIARYLNEEEWLQWCQLVDHFVFVVRDPILQLYSMVLRTANDWHAGYGSYELSDREAWACADRIGCIFRDGGTINGRPIPANFERLSWQSLQRHLTLLDQQISPPRTELVPQGCFAIEVEENRITIVDSSLLRADPKAQMTELFSRLWLPTDDATITRCVSGWNVGHVRRDDCPRNDAYRNKVNEARAIAPPLDKAPLFAEIPLVFQKYLVEIALPIYRRFLSRKEVLGPKRPKALLDLFTQKAHDTCLLDLNAITAYGLTANLQGLPQSEQRRQASVLTHLHMSYPGHQKVFARL